MARTNTDYGTEATATTSADGEYDPYLSDLLAQPGAIQEANSLLTPADLEIFSEIGSSDFPNPTSTLSFQNLGEGGSLVAQDLIQRPFICVRRLKQAEQATQGLLLSDCSSILARLSRNHVWAVAFVESEVLDFFLDLLDSQTSDTASWTDDAIKVVANCCTRSERTKVSTYSKAPIILLVQRLARKPTAPLAAKALSAIIGGYDRALEETEQQFLLGTRLLDGIENDFFVNDDLDVLLQLFEDLLPYLIACTYNDTHLRTIRTISARFKTADTDLVVLSNMFLQLTSGDIIRTRNLGVCLHILLEFFSLTYPEDVQVFLMRIPADLQNAAIVQNGEKHEVLTRVRKDMITHCAKWTFISTDFPSIVQDIHLLIQWLRYPDTQAQTFACILLGNIACQHPQFMNTLMAQSDLSLVLSYCVGRGKIQTPLTSAFDLLQNLATRPNRNILGRDGLFGSLRVHWQQMNPLAARALYHTRQLVHDCPANALRFLGHDSSAIPGETEPLLETILHTYAGNGDKTIRAEIGKVIAEIWRTLEATSQIRAKADDGLQPLPTLKLTPQETLTGRNTGHVGITDSEDVIRNGAISAPSFAGQSEADDASQITETIFAGQQRLLVIEPILGLVMAGNDTLSSQGWFSLSLMAHRRTGGEAVYDACIKNKDSFDALTKTISEDGTHPSIRSNAQYLVAMLRKHFVRILYA